MYTQITKENADDFRVGTSVRFDYGVMCGQEFGTITGQRTTQWGTELIAQTDDGEIKTISGITTIGIGVYVIDRRTHMKNMDISDDVPANVIWN